MAKKSSILIIMDGWGLGKVESADAISHAKTPFVSSLYAKYPNSTLVTCGESVGLPEGQMGNSEVGHLNIGAGRIVYQELQRINVAIRDGSFAKNPVLLDALRKAKSQKQRNCTCWVLSATAACTRISITLKPSLTVVKRKGSPMFSYMRLLMAVIRIRKADMDLSKTCRTTSTHQARGKSQVYPAGIMLWTGTNAGNV